MHGARRVLLQRQLSICFFSTASCGRTLLPLEVFASKITAGLVCANDTFGKSVGIIWKSTCGVLRKTCTWNIQNLRCGSFCLGLIDHGRLSSEVGWDLRTCLEIFESYLTMIPNHLLLLDSLDTPGLPWELLTTIGNHMEIR